MKSLAGFVSVELLNLERAVADDLRKRNAELRAGESKLMSSTEALSFARERGCFCRVTAGGFGLAFYTGDELQPGTWMEIGRTGMAQDDKASVSRNAVNLICRR